MLQPSSSDSEMLNVLKAREGTNEGDIETENSEEAIDIRVEELFKMFDSQAAVNNLSFNARRGNVSSCVSLTNFAT